MREQHRLYNEVRREQGLVPMYYKMAANNPRNPTNRVDVHEEYLTDFFNAHLDQKKYRELVEQQGRKYLVVGIPFLENNQACLRCHDARSAAPKQLQERYPGEGAS